MPGVCRSAAGVLLALLLGALPVGAAEPLAENRALQPTRGDDLPAALLGRAPAPLGESVAYLPGDPE